MVGERGIAESNDIQRRYFERADAERFRWTTGTVGFAETEDALLAPVLEEIAGPCLEIGCGEGNNLVRLSSRVRCVGVDRFFAKLAFAAQQVPGVAFSAADASALPFRNDCFRAVFIRDLLHHVAHPDVVLAEAVRVLAPTGRLYLLEPNGRNPLLKLQARFVPAEAGVRASTVAHIHALLSGMPLTDLRVWTTEPLQLRRLLLHYRFGFPSIGRYEIARRGLSALERVLGRAVPRSRWAYIAATAVRAG